MISSNSDDGEGAGVASLLRQWKTSFRSYESFEKYLQGLAHRATLWYGVKVTFDSPEQLYYDLEVLAAKSAMRRAQRVSRTRHVS